MKFEDIDCSMIIDNLHDGLYFVDKNRIITYWNKAAEQISGFSSDEVIGKSCSDNILAHIDKDGNNLCTKLCPLARTIVDGKPREDEIYLHHKDGHRILVSVRISALADKDNNIIGGTELFTDISSRESYLQRIKELEKYAFLDNLTQLPNRYYIEREIRNRFEEKKRYQMDFGVLFIDIDHFKRVNDGHGHTIGDNVLKFVSNTLVSNARPFDLIGRWGGDEFLGIIRNINNRELEQLGNRLRLLIKNSYIIHEDEKITVTISIGATLANENDNIDRIIKRADTQLLESKNAGRDRLTM